jgi:hypothetical protein
MTTAISTAGRSPARRRFNMGCDTIHHDEIELAGDLHKACQLVFGKQRSRQIAQRSPATLFRRMRYGRAFDSSTKRQSMILVSDNSPFLHHNKATNRHIIRPTARCWSTFVEQVRRVATLPRWADGWCATAETLDDLGFAIAESIATLLCWGIESDEGVIFYDPKRKERRIMLCPADDE